MTVHIERCLLCTSENHRFFESVHDGGQDLEYRLCMSCGLVFQSPRISDEALSGFYESGYRELVQGEEGPSEKDLRIQAGRARNLVEFSRSKVEGITTHLDIGSSGGALMLAFRNALECEVVGVEPGRAYRTFSQERGLQIVADLNDLDEGWKHGFDLVTMSHVLEHVPDPVDYLRHIRLEWLSPRGYLLIEVPNIFGHQAMEFSHLTAFSAASLRRLLERSSFELLALDVHGKPRSRLIPLYLTALARVLVDPLPEIRYRNRGRIVPLRRKIGMIWHRVASRLVPSLAWLPWPELED
jgi:SAM-dependent methyltransferase